MSHDLTGRTPRPAFSFILYLDKKCQIGHTINGGNIEWQQ